MERRHRCAGELRRSGQPSLRRCWRQSERLGGERDARCNRRVRRIVSVGFGVGERSMKRDEQRVRVRTVASARADPRRQRRPVGAADRQRIEVSLDHIKA